jgi:hypothetical protein
MRRGVSEYNFLFFYTITFKNSWTFFIIFVDLLFHQA